MKIRFKKIKWRHRGFIALTATLVIVAIVTNFSFLTLSTAVIFADSVFRKEIRIQTGLNLLSCTDLVISMFAHDYFINGNLTLSEYNCQVFADNDFAGNVTFTATSSMSNIKFVIKKLLHNDGETVYYLE